ncbi:DUF4165 domain-containing protein [Vibrio sp. SCSIO 43140]|uniref:Ig-like domain-containing protein n=1 Tax=Vibrio sp. SCSIO 43140 TaxID=2819100 RepID=UPI0020754D95|nr:Ig-like domain-containing protein [Vibrio sp. SCSIO 43140]USD58839.1 DUF4165 domain-containing protein [Vibrio sp. SCSIO 43140]
MKLQTLLAILLLLVTNTSFAAIEGFEFVDTNNTDRLIPTSTNTATLINNSSSIGVHISAGLDRKIEVKVLEEGALIGSASSGVITINDSYSPFGNEYFGTYLEIPLPLDGTYVIEATTLSLSGDVVDTTSTSIIRDTKQPSGDDLSVKYMYGGHINSLLPQGSWYLSAQMGSYTSTLIQVSNIEDTSGIRSVDFESFTLDSSGNPVFYKSVGMTYSVSLQTAEVNLSSHGSIFPSSNGDVPYAARAKITDNAGNISYTAYQSVYWDSVRTDTLEAYGVKVPGSTNIMAGLTGFDPYVNSMEVDENPVTILYRVAAWNYRDSSGNFNNPGGLMVSGATAIYTDRDDGYVYFTDTGPIGSITIHWRNQAHYRNVTGPSLYTVVPSDKAPITPRALYGQYFYSDWGTFGNWSRRVYKHELPLSIEKIRLHVEPRNFEQIARHGGSVSCIIPVGETYCDAVLATPWEMTEGSARYFHDYFNVRNTEESLVSNPTYPVGSYNDLYYPSIENTAFDSETKELFVRIVQDCQDCYQKRIGLSKYQLQDINGNSLGLSPKQVSQNAGTFEVVYDLTQLPEGAYSIYAYAEERHGPSDTTFALDYNSDKTAPVISFGYEGGAIPSEVSDLRNVSFTLTDPSSISEIEILLTGSRYQIEYQLGYSLLDQQGNSTSYTLELPKLFPTLEEGETYQIQVSAADEYGNRSSKTVNISYKPDNLIIMEPFYYVPFTPSTPIYIADGSPLGLIYTNSALTLENSMLATGVQTAEMTNNAASSFPIGIESDSGWVEILPGQTKEFGIDLGNGEPLYVEIYPITNGNEGTADFIFNINQLTSEHLHSQP